MKMLVLAGGFGSRLQSVVNNVPKALAPVGGAPFLHYQLEHWVAQGICSFVFLLHHKADLIKEFLVERAGGVLSGCEVQSVTEPVPLDTGGAVANAVRQLGLDGEIIITNADTWLGGGIPELREAGADAMLVVRQPDVSRYGQVDFDSAGYVSAFCEKSESQGTGWINAGMCMLQTAHFHAWDGQCLSLEKVVFPKLLAGGQLRAVPISTDFIDIGVPQEYERFCRWQVGGREDKLCN